MKILAVGDVTSPAGVSHLCDRLWKFRRERNVDFCVVNGENASFISGISPSLAEDLLRGGADVITGGNHTLRNKAIYPMLERECGVLRPINFPGDLPGAGSGIFDASGRRLLVINAMGCVHIEPALPSPYPMIDRVLEREAGNYDLALLDVHAEATGEKLAMGFAYDGKISVVFGTHTHVPTADARILPNGTGYISDLGMCGESDGVLGMEPAGVVERMRGNPDTRFSPAAGEVIANGVIFTVDEKTKRTTAIERVDF